MTQPVITIQSGIAIPPANRGTFAKGKGAYDAALTAMKPGDSFTISKKKVGTVFSAARRLGVKLTTRTEDKESLRVWRIEEKPTPA